MSKSSSPSRAPLPPSSPFVSAYSVKNKVSISFPDQGRTKQSFKDECDINLIMARYMKTGVLDFVTKHAPQYRDVTGLDYQAAMQQVAKAQSMFMDLPSAIRSRFENNPALFLDFVQDPANEAEMHQLGLLRPDYVPKRPDAPAPSVAQPQPEKPAEKPAA